MAARIVQIETKIEVVYDDGEHLIPVPVEPLSVSGYDVPHFVRDGFEQAVADLLERVNEKYAGTSN